MDRSSHTDRWQPRGEEKMAVASLRCNDITVTCRPQIAKGSGHKDTR